MAATLRAWRTDAGYSHEELAVYMSERLPRSLKLSRDKVRRYEAGEVDASRMDTFVLAAWASITGQSLSELGPAYDEDQKVLALLVEAGLEGDPDQVRTGNRWTDEGALHPSSQPVAA